MTSKTREIIGGPLVIGGRRLSLSRAVRAGDLVFLTGQIPMRDGAPMTTGTIEEQTRAALDLIGETLREAGCDFADVGEVDGVARAAGGLSRLQRGLRRVFPGRAAGALRPWSATSWST